MKRYQSQFKLYKQLVKKLKIQLTDIREKHDESTAAFTQVNKKLANAMALLKSHDINYKCEHQMKLMSLTVKKLNMMMKSSELFIINNDTESGNER